MNLNFGLVIPMANEQDYFQPFVTQLVQVLDNLQCGTVYFIVDTVSKDHTLNLCQSLSAKDKRFKTLWVPENKNVVDAYLAGYKIAIQNKHDFILEMDAGLSHDPQALPLFLKALNSGHECVFGSRFIAGGSIQDSTWKRTFLSKMGTILSNVFLGSTMHDMTSGFQGFQSKIVEKFLAYGLLSKAHFYQTELRYLLRESAYIEIPIHYKSPSPRVSARAISNSLYLLWHYFILRIKFKAAIIK